MKPAALFLFIALLLASSPIPAQTFTKECSTGQELEYRVLSDPKTVEVKKVTNMGTSSNVIIPKEVSYKGRKYAVTAIGSYMFYNCSGLTTITIPTSVTSIGYSAFEKCENLTSITLPNTVTSIGEEAFAECLHLTTITLPNSLTAISNRMFYKCSSLTTITIPNTVTSIGEWAFAKCENLTAITLPPSVSSIGEEAFSGCVYLSSITLPNTLTSIGKRAFHNCLNIISLTIPSSVVSIGDEAFSECVSMTAVLIPNSVTEIGHEIFANCHSLHNVVIASDNPVYQLSSTNVGDSERIILIDKRTGHEFEAKGDIILRDPEVKARFHGEVDSLKKYLNENVKLSPRCIEVQCVVILEFVVETDGSITSINVLSSYCGGCQEYVNDAVRLVKAMPKWNPAQDEEQPCRSYFQLPITYCLR